MWLRCRDCGALVGSFTLPTPAEMKEQLRGSPYAAMAGLIPPNVAEGMVQMLTVLCPRDSQEALPTDASEEAQREEEAHGEEVRHDDTDAGGEPRRVSSRRRRS